MYQRKTYSTPAKRGHFRVPGPEGGGSGPNIRLDCLRFIPRSSSGARVEQGGNVGPFRIGRFESLAGMWYGPTAGPMDTGVDVDGGWEYGGGWMAVDRWTVDGGWWTVDIAPACSGGCTMDN